MRCPGCYPQASSSFLILSFTSRSVITPLRILTGVPCPVLRFFTSSSFSHFAEGDGGHAALEEAIWTHSALSITMDLRKSGQRLVRRRRDSIASAVEMGVRELLTTTLTTSSMGIVRLLRVGGVGFVDGLWGGAENSIQTASATPPSRPSKHRLLISFGPISRVLSSPSALRIVISTEPFADLLGVVRDLSRTRSKRAARREDEEGVTGGTSGCR